MIGLGLLRGVFLGGIMMWYSMAVWKTVDQYFRDQFQEYLTKEYEENSALKKDVLMEKERMAARKVLLEKIEKLDSSLEPEYGDSEGEDGGGISYLGEHGTERVIGDGWLGNGDHGSYSVEEVAGGRGPGEAGEPGGHGVVEGTPPLTEEDGGGVGECLVEDCGGHGDQVSTRWRNVFDEDADVCHFDEGIGAQGSCSQADEVGDEFGGNK